MLKATLRNCFNRLRSIGNVSDRQVQPLGRLYRSGFQRASGAIMFLFAYFLLASKILDGGEGSPDNQGIFILLFFAVMAAGLGAFFAPRIAAFLYAHSMSGRRQRAGKSRHGQGSKTGRSVAKEHSSPARSTRQSKGDHLESTKSGRSD